MVNERGDERADEQRLAGHERDRDAREDGVLQRLAEEGEPTEQHVHPDDATDHTEQEHLDQRPGHERRLERFEQQAPQHGRAVSAR